MPCILVGISVSEERNAVFFRAEAHSYLKTEDYIPLKLLYIHFRLEGTR
jgi:hypothetical protein